MKEALFYHQEVADLAWCIRSHPLMQSIPNSPYKTLDSDWCELQYQQFLDRLRVLDRHPDPLLEVLASAHKLPLGKRFERFILFWLRHHHDFEVLAENVQLNRRSPNREISDKPRAVIGRIDVDRNGTLGEMDVLLRSRKSGEIFHLEMACKFYIARRNSMVWNEWVGPNGRDSLDLKMEKLNRQLAITTSPEGIEWLHEHQLTTPQPLLLMKGMFFHHFKDLQQQKPPQFAAKNYESGWWCNSGEADQMIRQEGTYIMLPKSNWLGGFHTDFSDRMILKSNQLIEACRAEIARTGRAQMVAQVFPGAEGWIELHRGFIANEKRLQQG